ncbi:MAG: pyridoxamine kinase [Lachnospiraceae bacterium]|nr:pyridoxamine kinase [Ruminococcus sp.]MCM1274731.1 pyridoxamine kinase [Lachnospiraceae bacterium]
MKRIATIQDFSCVGKCSLTVALPIISAAGIECCGIPTAVLSNHTGFPSFYSRDLTEDIPKICGQLGVHGIAFDAISTGYIASISQMSLIEGFIREFRREKTLVFVDPVMGDYGRLYSQITPQYAEKMRGLCAHADIITPNLTEAYMLLGRAYSNDPDEEELRGLLRGLSELGAETVVITGIQRGDEIGCAALCGGELLEAYAQRRDVRCSGTGDIFSSALLSAILREKGFERALEVAVEFVGEAARLTAADPDRPFYGVNFERALPYLIKLLES